MIDPGTPARAIDRLRPVPAFRWTPLTSAARASGRLGDILSILQPVSRSSHGPGASDP
jgi:hypothetical protein